MSTPTSRPGDVRKDDLISKTEETETSAARNLFDLRTIIGGLFVVYGAYLAIRGLADGAAAIDQAAGVRINLWTGLAALLVGALFLTWALLRPLTIEEIVEGTADSIDHDIGHDKLRDERESAARGDR